jgi:hypothetical protein
MAASKSALYMCREWERHMSEERDDQERPCLHCMMVEMIDDFFAEYPATAVGQTKSIPVKRMK